MRNNNLRSLGPSFATTFPSLEQLNADSNDLGSLDLAGAESLTALSVSFNRCEGGRPMDLPCAHP